MTKTINAELEKRFTDVFNKKLWGDKESLSGPGSRKDNPMATSALSALETVIDAYGIETIADIPCGDFNFLAPLLTKYPNIKYFGYDIVRDLVLENRRKQQNLSFEIFDIVSDVPPRADLVFTKELLIHLKNDDVSTAIENICKSGAKYLLASNSFGVENQELTNDSLGYARPIDLTKSPFNFPEPLWKNWFYALWDIKNIYN